MGWAGTIKGYSPLSGWLLHIIYSEQFKVYIFRPIFRLTKAVRFQTGGDFESSVG